MAAVRGLGLFGVLLIAPGCALMPEIRMDSFEPVSTSTAPPKTTFGELITAPGQSVAKNPGVVPDEPQPIPPTVIAKAPPTAGTVPPPMPRIEPPPQPGSSTPGPDAPLLPPLFPHRATLDTPFLAAVRAYQDGRPDYALEHLRHLPSSSQDVLIKLLPAAARSAEGHLHDPAEATDVLRQIESAAAVLRPRSELRMDVIRLCSKWTDYGEYDPVPAGQSLRPGAYLFLYAEVRGVVPEEVPFKDGEPGYLIRFRAAFRCKGGGKLKEESKSYFRHTRSPARDICVPYGFTAPETPGFYVVEFELTDTAGRKAKQSIEFRVDDRK